MFTAEVAENAEKNKYWIKRRRRDILQNLCVLCDLCGEKFFLLSIK